MIGVGLTGAHRTGKTTLAKAYAAASEIPYLTISASAVIARKGWECKDIRDPLVRIDVQKALVEECDRVFNVRQRAHWVSDRTPLDVAAYLLADMGQDRLPPDAEATVIDLVTDCIDITNAVFGGLLICPDVLPYKPEPGKPIENRAYSLHVETLIRGLVNDERVTVQAWQMDRGILDMEQRMEVIDEIFLAVIEEIAGEAELAEMH